MSIQQLLTDGPKPWANLKINNMDASGNIIVAGNLIVTGSGGSGFTTTDILCENLTATESINASGQKIINCGDPVIGTDVVNLQYFNSHGGGGGGVPTFGDIQTALNSPTGDLNIPGGTYTYSSSKAANTNTELIRKQEFDSGLASTLSTAETFASNTTKDYTTQITGKPSTFPSQISTLSVNAPLVMGSQNISTTHTPSLSADITNKLYVDSANSSLQSQITSNSSSITTLQGKFPIQSSDIGSLQVTNAKINDIAYSKLTSVPTSFASKTSTLTVDSGVDFGVEEVKSSFSANVNEDLTNKLYVDNAIGNALATSGFAQSGFNTDITNIQLNNNGLTIKSQPSGLNLITILDSSNVTANRSIDIQTGDASRVISLTGNPSLGNCTVSGTNTGDQTITLTSDVVGTGTSSIATTISNNAVTTSKINNLAVTDAKINDVAYTKITSLPSTFPSKTSTLTVDSGVDFGANEIKSSFAPVSGSDLVNKTYADSIVAGGGITTLVQYVNVGDNATSAIANASFQSQVQFASTAFTINGNTNYTLNYVGGGQNLMNVLYQSSAKKGPIGNGTILQSTGTVSYQSGPTLRGLYWNDIQFTFASFTIRPLLSGSFTNCTFDGNIVIDGGTGFVAFSFCTFNSGATLTINNSNACSIYFQQCAFSGITVTNNVLLANTSTNIFLTTCSGLRNFTDLQASGRCFYSGINSTLTDSREFVATFSPYDAITGTQHLWTSAEIAALTIATGNIANSAITYAKMQNVTAFRVLGNSTASAASPNEMNLGSTLLISGSTIITNPMTGDITTPSNSFVTTIGANAVTTAKVNALAITDAKINDVATSKLTGTISTTQIGALQVTDAKINDVSSTKITGTISNTQIANLAVTNAKINDVNSSKFVFDSDMSIGTNKINTTATSWSSGQMIPKSYVDNLLGFTTPYFNKIFHQYSLDDLNYIAYDTSKGILSISDKTSKFVSMNELTLASRRPILTANGSSPSGYIARFARANNCSLGVTGNGYQSFTSSAARVGSITVFMVFSMNAVNSLQQSFWNSDGGPGFGKVFGYDDRNGSGISTGVFSFAAFGGPGIGSNVFRFTNNGGTSYFAPTANTFYCVTVRYSTNTTTITTGTNEPQYLSTWVTTGSGTTQYLNEVPTPGIDAATSLYIGSTSTQIVDNAEIDFCELLTYNSKLDSTQISNVQSYLVSKWNL